MAEKADFTGIEKKWQKRWEDNEIFKVDEKSKNPKYYNLEMFPYPSGSGLHMGHALNYTIGDVYARFKRMNGFNVLYPMGYDAFGLPAENAAIKAGEHPRRYTENSIANFITQQKALGISYDWSRMVVTSMPGYYRWNQWFFIKFFENGLVYRKKSSVNWCPKCSTVLANEQVHSGKCWRHEDTDVEVRHLEQWFIKTTRYADELLEKVKSLKWPERIKLMQENWIGKSFGTEILFEINGENWPIFTTRPDTLFGVTFMVVSAQHPRLMELVTKEQKKEVEEFLKRTRTTTLKNATAEELDLLEKDGVFTGSYAVNPAKGEKVPVYAGNFVIADYGSGMVMAVPAHDQRDFEFAKKYNIPIKLVISPDAYDIDVEKMSRAYVEEGNLVNSGEFNGSRSTDAICEITGFLEKKGLGKKVVQFKLRDWLISRQRYWGTPIPMIYCDKCGIVAVPEKNLPVLLPNDVKFGEGNPLAGSESFVNAKCPKCGGDAKRETDTMDTFFDSSWYFLRYCDNGNSKKAFDVKKVGYWMPVDQYIGGAEHACMHLIYARFFVKALRDMKMLDFDEPFTRLFNQGMLHGSDGNKMSKSLGNVINPIEMIEKYGADALRFNLMTLASPDKDSMWSDRGIESAYRFVNKVFSYFQGLKPGFSSAKIESRLHKTIRDYTSDIEAFRYNLGVIKLRMLFERIEKEPEISMGTALAFLKMLHPFCPHLTEELWERIGNKGFLSLAEWPDYDENKIDENAEMAEELAESTRADVRRVLELAKIASPKKITIIISDAWKYAFISLLKSKMAETRDFKQIIGHFAPNPEMKKHLQDIQKILPKILADDSKLPAVVLDQKTEMKSIDDTKDLFRQEFGAEFEVVAAENSKEQKARQAMPGKPAIVVE